MTGEIDFSARYEWTAFRGVAFYLLGYKRIQVQQDLEFQYDEPEFEDDVDVVVGVMVGDDHRWDIPVDELVPLDENGYCRECGQVGCMHGR